MRWCALYALFPVLGLFVVYSAGRPASARAAGFDEDPPSELATVLVNKAKRAEKAGDLAQAYVFYSQASALEPRNRGYRTHAAALQLRGAAQIKSASTPTAALPKPDADAPDLSDATDPEVQHTVLPSEYMFDSITARGPAAPSTTVTGPSVPRRTA